MRKSEYDIHTGEYDAWYDDNPGVYASELTAIMQLMPATIPEKSVEIGVGTGRFAAKLGIPYGLDPATNMLAIAQKRNIECIKGIGEKLPFKDSSLELAIIVTSFCLMEAEKALDEACRVLVPSGYLIIAFVEKSSPLGEKYRKKAAKSRFFRGVRFCKAEEIISMLEEHGFGNMKSMQTLFKPLNMIKEAETPEKGLGKGSFVTIRARCIKNE